MTTKNEKEIKKCRVCKSILVEDSKLGLCPKCINKYGTPTAAVAVIALVVAGKQALKNSSGKIVKLAKNIIKHI